MSAIALLASAPPEHFPRRQKAKMTQPECDKMSMLCLHVELVHVNFAGRQCA